MSGAMVRRLAPPDRRAPVQVARRGCPQGASCYCCPGAAKRAHRNCPLDHPVQDRACSQPMPERIPACRERTTLTQTPPTPPIGCREPHISCCVECGRVTARRWTDPEGRELPWCAGLFPNPIKER